jgi:hypothetical protein
VRKVKGREGKTMSDDLESLFASDDWAAPANLDPKLGAKDHSEEAAMVDRDLAAVDRHVSVNPLLRGEAFAPLQGTFPVPETRTDLKGREYPQQKPPVDREDNYPAGESGFAISPNRNADGSEAAETLEG